MIPNFIYKITSQELWQAAIDAGKFTGAPVDIADGYIHFSTADQVAETARRHFAGLDGLLLVRVATDRLGPALRFEPSRGGALFPHLYDVLSLDAVVDVMALARGADGHLILAELPT